MRGCCPDYRGTGHGDWSDPYGCPSCYRTGHLHPEEEKCTMDKTLSDWQAEVREVNEANGWHDTERTFGDGTALLHRDRKSTRLNSSHSCAPRMPSSA